MKNLYRCVGEGDLGRLLLAVLVSVGVGAGFVVSSGVPALAGGVSSDAGPNLQPSKVIERDDFSVMPGDVVRLSFLEKIRLSEQSPKKDGVKEGSAPVLRSFFERTDLSGEFEVASGGAISHPILGLVSLVGKQLHEIEATLKQAIHKKIGEQQISVRARFIQRPPVYVSGLVGRPGAYKFVQGMTVAQAVTLASGLYRPADQRQLVQAASRERARIIQLERKLARVLVRKARLEAESTSGKRVEVSPVLVELVGKEKAQVLVASESAVLKERLKLKMRRRRTVDEVVELAEAEVEELQDQKQTVRRQAKVIEKQLKSYKRNFKPDYYRASVQAVNALTRVEMMRLNVKNAQSKAEGDLLQAQQRKSKAEQHRLSLNLVENEQLRKELDDLEVLLIEHETNLDSARQVVDQLSSVTLRGLMPLDSLVREKDASYEISRRVNGRLSVIDASGDSFVRPGDIVRVNLGTELAK